jgi:hypothetical protein
VATITAITDTFVNSGSAGTNYSTETYTEIYTWPFGTVANRGLYSIDISSLPDNISITAAALEMYMSAFEGGGGSELMRSHVYPVTSMPDLTTVTWTNFSGTLGSSDSYTDVSLTPGWVSFNVLTSTQNAHSGSGTLALAIDGGSSSAQDTNRRFVSMEGTEALRPRLKVTYTQNVAPGGPSISAPGKIRVSKARMKSFH